MKLKQQKQDVFVFSIVVATLIGMVVLGSFCAPYFVDEVNGKISDIGAFSMESIAIIVTGGLLVLAFVWFLPEKTEQENKEVILSK